MDLALAPDLADAVSSGDPLTHYCIVRGDLPRGVMAAALIHAAGESSPGNLHPGTYAIALAARDSDHLVEIARMVTESGCRCQLIKENEGLYAGQTMALGVEPKPKSELYKLFSSLPLVK